MSADTTRPKSPSSRLVSAVSVKSEGNDPAVVARILLRPAQTGKAYQLAHRTVRHPKLGIVFNKHYLGTDF